MTLVLAHVSDLHCSEFGDTFHDRLRVVKRTTNPAAIDPVRYEIAWEEAGWRVFREREKKRAKLMLVARLVGIVPHLTRARQQRMAANAART